ncbi:hypothetical protein TIFTF001_020513 [Ficus carica]|uniref:Ubiquitin-like protease family profile domain-containing protein n=1 Tax=Ficus carica TaxID=3494 RepID=A0AA88DCN6_FICCA|nr:hypothetical protein TIFTF001_020513 [Ficus carica]
MLPNALHTLPTYSTAPHSARTHARQADNEEELSTQTQIGKPRRTNSPRCNPDEDGKRRATLLRRVHIVRSKGERIEVSFNTKGQPLGKEGDELQSWIGVLAREHIPIWISDFRSADLAPRKERVWVEVFEKTGKWAERHTRENAEVSDMKRQLAALERTVHELCVKHGINRETMAEETTAPTVDQHNSFKASCTLNEKEARPSDPQPMPNASKECQLFLTDLVNGGDVLIAIGKAYMDCVPTDTIHVIPLGKHKVPVMLLTEKLREANEPKREQGRRKYSHNRRYLADCCARVGMDQRFEFISLVLVSPIQQNVDREAYVREKADNILRILRNAPKGKLFLMPYNSGQHWILALIDPWDDSVLYFNPVGNEPGDDFKDLITIGLRKRRNCGTLIDIVRCPIQEGYVECGYFVLAFMREITLTVDGLALLQTKDFYTDADMSLVRPEWATFVMQFIQY